MRKHRNTVLAGVAALALLAGTGLASAQEPQNHNSAPEAKQPRATQEMNKAPAGGKMGQSTQEQKPAGRAAETNKADKAMPSGNRAQTEQRQPAEKKGGMTQRNETNAPRTAEEPANKGGQATTQERERAGDKGMQSNASRSDVRLSEQQRTQIRDTIIHAQGAPRVGNVNFDVTVGTVIPRDGVRIVPVPDMLVQIEPTWRGFLYFVYEDEVVIVDPRDMRIVAVVPA
jgi:hypothetical protein